MSAGASKRMQLPREAGELESYRVLIKRLPLTIRPAFNGQLGSWDTLFPFERQRFRDLMRGVGSFDAPGFDALIAPLRQLESKMNVQSWNFSQSTDTMENASLLARSADYSEWRNQVQRFYSAVQNAARSTARAQAEQSRIVVAILPKCLPFDPSTVWKKWKNLGIELSVEGEASSIAELLLKEESPVLKLSQEPDPSDLWLIDAVSGISAFNNPASILTCAALNPLRERVLAEVNTVPKSIEVTDQTLAAIRAHNWDQWWPPELKSNPLLHKFVMDVYLSGNGALIFSNAFVQWAANEAIRRARPRVLIARFGMRAKPKPFTGIAIFENQQRISALPDVDDPQGSALDAVVLARYILLSAQRYPESEQTAFLCIAESAQSAYLVLPDALKSTWNDQKSATSEQIAQYLINHLSARTGDHS
jgi:hypothetical protein